MSWELHDKQHGKIIEKWENYAWKHNHKKNWLIYLSFLINHAYNYIMISFINSFIKLIKEIRVEYLKTRHSEPRMHANLLWCFDLFLDLWSFTLKIKKDLFCSKNEDLRTSFTSRSSNVLYTALFSTKAKIRPTVSLARSAKLSNEIFRYKIAELVLANLAKHLTDR